MGLLLLLASMNVGSGEPCCLCEIGISHKEQDVQRQGAVVKHTGENRGKEEAGRKLHWLSCFDVTLC